MRLPKQLEPSPPPDRLGRPSARPGPFGVEQLVTAAQLAELLQVERCWVYDHKELLGARYLGDGPRARLRFSPSEADAALRRAREGDPSVRSRPLSRRRRRAGKPPKTSAGNALLPLPGEAAS